MRDQIEKGGRRCGSGKKGGSLPPPPLIWNYARLIYDEPQLSSLELAKFRIFSNVCFAGVAVVAKRKARKCAQNKDPEEHGSNEELEEPE